MTHRTRLDWPTAMFWGTATPVSIACVVGLATWSWQGLVLVLAGLAALFALLMVAVVVFGRNA